MAVAVGDGRCRGRSRRWRWRSIRSDAYVIDVFFEIEGGGVRDIASGIVRNDCDVIAHLVLVRITEERIERDAYRDIGRPGIACIGAIRIEQLRIGVVGGVSRVQPDGIESSIRRDGKRAEPMPFVLIDRIVVYTLGVR